MNDNNLNLNNDLAENDFLSRIDNLTKDLSTNELLMLSDYISQKAKSSNSSVSTMPEPAIHGLSFKRNTAGT